MGRTLEPTANPRGEPLPDTTAEAMHRIASDTARGVERIAKVEADLDELALRVFHDIQAARYEPSELALELGVEADVIYLAYERVKYHIEKVIADDQPPKTRPLPSDRKGGAS